MTSDVLAVILGTVAWIVLYCIVLYCILFTLKG